MSDKEKVLQYLPDAECFTKDVMGAKDSLIRAGGRDITGWCYTEERAWGLAARLCEERRLPKKGEAKAEG